ncbi:MAG: ABC transporter substrate-binding protein [Comamonas sp.]
MPHTASPVRHPRRRRLLQSAAAILATSAALWSLPPAYAETGTVRIAKQFGLPYLPLIVAQDQGLIEKHAQALGVPVKVEWVQLASGTGITEALLAGAVDFTGGGIGPLLLLWDRTQGKLGVKAVAGLDGSTAFLTSNNPAVKTIADFSEKDRIALPGVKVSAQAQWLQLAASRLWGIQNYTRLDALTVSLPHPDATAALIAGKSEITANFAVAPFAYQQIASPNIHVVTTSDEILGGPATNTFLYGTTPFRKANPQVFKAVFEAIREAHQRIAADKAEAARAYVRVTQSKQTPEEILAILQNPAQRAVLAARGTYAQAEFLHRIGTLKHKPASWKDYVFPELQAFEGS